MNFEYEGSGTAEIIGCSAYKWVNFLYYGFAIGSTVYSKPKAVRGQYEKVVIKAVRLPQTYANAAKFGMSKFCSLGPLYTDTLNSLWNEEDLVSFSQASELIEDYQIRQGILAEEAFRKCR